MAKFKRILFLDHKLFVWVKNLISKEPQFVKTLLGKNVFILYIFLLFL